MTVEIITENNRVIECDRAIVKTSGWVKYQRDGEIHHFPPHRVRSIHEREPTEKTNYNGEPSGHFKSDVVYQSPHGKV